MEEHCGGEVELNHRDKRIWKSIEVTSLIPVIIDAKIANLIQFYPKCQDQYWVLLSKDIQQMWQSQGQNKRMLQKCECENLLSIWKQH